ncbi:MAG: glycogen debranching protein GlgX [Chthoniobacterales bacterium]
MSVSKKNTAPAHYYKSFELRYGHPLPFGASHVPGGVNFAIYSAHAEVCILVLFRKGEEKPFAEIPFPMEFRMGQVFAMTVMNLDYEVLEYGYRFDGPNEPQKGLIFDPKKIVLDPYAREIGGCQVWKQVPPETALMPQRGRVPFEDFEWGADRPLRQRASDLVIYEMHVRGFTQHPSGKCEYPGTYRGLQEKISYLQELGVNCVELMPVFEFDELENPRVHPETGEALTNYWGYSTVAFFAPKSAYSASAEQGGAVSEVKEMVQALHAADISVMLDVVFNHTAEGGEGGPVISFKGVDNSTYYMLGPDGSYVDYTGCGNTVNCNHPVVRSFVLESLRHWAAEYHIDGFRFDLASVLGRAQDGAPLPNPPLLELLAHDPVLADCALVAEAWDAAGLYQVGNFPNYGRWSEWNGRYRDTARRFLKGDEGMVADLVQRILGSPDLYKATGRKPQASVNFITCHDGFTLRDLFSWNEKHNEENGEENRDGANDNYSWNCGVEGPTDDPEILAIRRRQEKNAMTLLFVSQGIPMIYMGDECGRTQRGNNNAYCQDTEWNWMDWKQPEEEKELFRFTKNMIAFRKAQPALRSTEWLTGKDLIKSGFPDISWHGTRPWKPDWTSGSRSLAFMLCGQHASTKTQTSDDIYCAFNSWHEPLTFTLPLLPHGLYWHCFVNTGLAAPRDIAEPGEEWRLENQKSITLESRSAVVLLGY